MTPLAERVDAVDRAGILSFPGMKSLQPGLATDPGRSPSSQGAVWDFSLGNRRPLGVGLLTPWPQMPRTLEA
jgi:hypothetical protein